jgi:hypothetical protein
MAVLFLSRALDVEQLCISKVGFPLKGFIEAINTFELKRRQKPLRGLQTLEILLGEHDSVLIDSLAKTLQLVDKLPSLDTLRVNGIADIDSEAHLPYTPNLSKIHFMDSSLGIYKVETLICNSKRLEEFSYIAKDYGRHRAGHIAPSVLGKALEYHKHTLRALDLDCDSLYQGVRLLPPDFDLREFVRGSSFASGSDPAPIINEVSPNTRDDHDEETGEGCYCSGRETLIGPLYRFSALKYLRINMRILLRSALYAPSPTPIFDIIAESLPPNLEYLVIVYYAGTNQDWDQIKQGFGRRMEGLPKLKEVRWERMWSRGRDLPFLLNRNDDDGYLGRY